MKVPLHFHNAEICPGVKESGGIVSHVMNDLSVTCLPADLPEFIEVDLASLALGHSIHVSDLKLPQGVEVAGHGNVGEAVVATVQIPRGAIEAEAEAAAAAEASATAAATTAAAAPAGDAKSAGKPAAKPAAEAKK